MPDPSEPKKPEKDDRPSDQPPPKSDQENLPEENLPEKSPDEESPDEESLPETDEPEADEMGFTMEEIFVDALLEVARKSSLSGETSLDKLIDPELMRAFLDT